MSGAFVETMKMIKIEHSVFALPFALVGAFLAADGLPETRVLVLVLVAMVCARSAAMAFNRLIDADIDAANPRTAVRSIPAGRLTRGYAAGFTVITSLLFIGSAWLLNPLAFKLSPFVLAVLLGYSLTKRFTSLCHFVLGLALGLAPLGAWIAVTGSFSFIPVVLGVAVLLWTAGFDIIYACQDIGFDKEKRLHSVPTLLGIRGSLWLSRLLHVIVLGILSFLGLHLGLNWIYWAGMVLVAGCLGYEHSLVWDGSLDKVDMAFFTMNGIVSLAYGLTTIISILTG
ncbi:MAG: UbiA-like polyprenyltransferase [Acidobacteriota bacterium]|nr:UbiA-like polyprenyltransferase [Acidobacteriota bacterium]